MIQLQPKQIFTVVRQIADPTDTTTYYVKAIIRKSVDGSILDTIELTDQGDQRFTGNWQVVEDSSGEGYLVDVTTIVYTDSGYTSVSPNYTKDNNTYLVQVRWSAVFGGGGGGGLDLTPNQLRKIISDEVNKIKIPKQEKVDLSNISKELTRVLDSVKNIKIPEQKKVDFNELVEKIDYVNKEIKKEISSIPKPEKINLEKTISVNRDDNERLSMELKKTVEEIERTFSGGIKRIEDFIVETKNRFDVSDKLRGVFDGISRSVENPRQNREKRIRNLK